MERHAFEPGQGLGLVQVPVALLGRQGEGARLAPWPKHIWLEEVLEDGELHPIRLFLADGAAATGRLGGVPLGVSHGGAHQGLHLRHLGEQLFSTLRLAGGH